MLQKKRWKESCLLNNDQKYDDKVDMHPSCYGHLPIIKKELAVQLDDRKMRVRV